MIEGALTLSTLQSHRVLNFFVNPPSQPPHRGCELAVFQAGGVALAEPTRLL